MSWIEETDLRTGLDDMCRRAWKSGVGGVSAVRVD